VSEERSFARAPALRVLLSPEMYFVLLLAPQVS